MVDRFDIADPVSSYTGPPGRVPADLFYEKLNAVVDAVNALDLSGGLPFLSVDRQDGATDDDRLAAALAAAAASDGAVIYFTPGSELTLAPFRVDTPNVTLNLNQARLVLAPGSNTSFITVGQDAYDFKLVGGGQVDGNKANQSGTSHAVYFEARTDPISRADRAEIAVSILDALTDGLHIGDDRLEVRMSDASIRGCGRHGWHTDGTDNVLSNVAVGVCDINHYINGHANVVRGGSSYTSSTMAIWITGSARTCIVDGVTIDTNSKGGVKAQGTSGSTIALELTNCTFRANSRDATGTYPHVYLDNVRSVLLDNLVFDGKADEYPASYCVQFGSTVNEVWIGTAVIYELAGSFPAANAISNDLDKMMSKSRGIISTRDSSSELVWASKINGDTNDRLEIRADGALVWGSGSGSGDVNLFRAGANNLQTNDQVTVERSASGDVAVNAKVTGDSGSRAALTAGGVLALGSGSGATDTSMSRNSAGILQADQAFRVATNLFLPNYVEWTAEISDPSAPASNRARLYLRDNGSGKTQLAIRFPTGAVQVIATEP